MNLDAEDMFLVLKVATRKPRVGLNYRGILEDDIGAIKDLIRLALERATYDEKTQIMAMVLGAKETETK